MAISAIGAVGQQGQQNPLGTNALSKVDMGDFIKLMITELSHQDPLNPMDSTDILQQMSQIREIQSNTELTETLNSVKLGQNVATAASLIGRRIVGLSDNARHVVGEVDRVSLEFGVPKLHVEGQVVDIRNVAAILKSEEPEPTTDPDSSDDEDQVDDIEDIDDTEDTETT